MRHLIPSFLIGLMVGLPADAQTVTDGSFKHDAAAPGILVLAGPIDQTVVKDFRRAQRTQEADVLILNSPGGNVQAALELSAILRDRNMATVIPPGATCASACAFLFVAGRERRAYGRLGVHQFTSNGRVEGAKAETTTQQVMAEIIDYLKEYKVPPQFLVRMLETPPDSMYWFPKAELRVHGIETLSTFPEELALYDSVPALSVPVPAAAPDVAPMAAPDPTRPAAVAPSPMPVFVSPSFDCAKAGTATEFAICNTTDLARLDAAMAAVYRDRRAAMAPGARQALTDSQRAWLARRNQCGADVGCLGIVYRSRLAELGG